MKTEQCLLGIQYRIDLITSAVAYIGEGGILYPDPCVRGEGVICNNFFQFNVLKSICYSITGKGGREMDFKTLRALLKYTQFLSILI